MSFSPNSPITSDHVAWNWNPFNWFAPSAVEAPVEPEGTPALLNRELPVETDPLPIDTEIESLPSDIPLHNETEVRVDGLEYTKMSLHHLITLLRVEKLAVTKNKIVELQDRVKKLSGQSSAVKSLMASLEATLSQGQFPVRLSENPDLEMRIRDVQASGTTHKLFDQQSFTKIELDGMVRFLQHTVSGFDIKLKDEQTGLTHRVEDYNTLIQGLMKIIQELRDLSHKIHAASR